MTALQKARALVECGECADLHEAAEFLLDMGEISQDQADRLLKGKAA